jgi:3-hydroxyacyl-CoA dehydrogenase
VGLDTLVKVAKGVAENCPDDEAKEIFAIPTWLNKMIENNWLGDKTGQGFFKKGKGAGGEKEILTLNLQTMEYGARVRPKFALVEAAKPIDDLKTRLKMLCSGTDKAGQFYKQFVFLYLIPYT